MKMSLTVNELIARLEKVENKDLEIWIKGNDGIICPCSTSEVDSVKNCVVLSEARPFDGDVMDSILKAIGQK